MINTTGLNDYFSNDLTNLVITPARIENDGSNNLGNSYLKIVFGNQDINNTIIFDADVFKAGILSFGFAQKRENYLITALRNYIRKVNFSELNDSLCNGDITEDQFEKELDKNEDKYVITLRDISKTEDARIIVELVEKIGFDLREFSSSEVAEMFSVKESKLLCHLNFVPQLLK